MFADILVTDYEMLEFVFWLYKQDHLKTSGWILKNKSWKLARSVLFLLNYSIVLVLVLSLFEKQSWKLEVKDHW